VGLGGVGSFAGECVAALPHAGVTWQQQQSLSELLSCWWHDESIEVYPQGQLMPVLGSSGQL
jgi:hypothetical protein